MKILLIDDNPDITDLLSKFLKAKGYDNKVANDPKDGLDAIINENYDVIFLDIHMPEFSGLDIIRSLESKKNSSKPENCNLFCSQLYSS